MLISDHEHREREIAEERERIDRLWEEEHRRHVEESERRIQDLRQQVAHLQDSLADRPTTAPRHGNGTESIKLTRLGEKDDIKAYLTTFERVMEVNEVSRERWLFQLAPQLTGKAQQAYAALTPEDAKDYDAVQTAILRRYNINEETYRQRFRTLKPKPEESPQEFMTRLQDLGSRWTRETSTHQELLDLLVREQFFNYAPPICQGCRHGETATDLRGGRTVCSELHASSGGHLHYQERKGPLDEMPKVRPLRTLGP